MVFADWNLRMRQGAYEWNLLAENYLSCYDEIVFYAIRRLVFC